MASIAVRCARNSIKGSREAQENLQTIVGTHKTVIPKIETLLQVFRPGIFMLFSAQGQVSNEDRLTSIRLMAEEVMPAIREYAAYSTESCHRFRLKVGS